MVRAAAEASAAGRELGEIAERARALAGLSEERRERVRTVYARADRIVGKAGEAPVSTVEEGLLADEAERALWQAFAGCESALAAAVDFDAAFTAVEALAAPMERFFEDVLVMAGGELQANRIRLLAAIRDRIRRSVGDLSLLPG